VNSEIVFVNHISCAQHEGIGGDMEQEQDCSSTMQISPAPRAGARITLPEKIDIQFMQTTQNERDPAMSGFNPRYQDFVDYIIGITHEIWEEKGVGKLYDYYANTIQIHTSSGIIYGREAVFASTLEALAAYPDRRLYGDEVVWTASGDCLYSSHRLSHAGTNRGWSLYGPPTGKKVRYLAIADCLCRRNMVIEEWLVRDELSLVLQLGLDPVATAKEMAAKARDAATAFQIHGDVERGRGQLPPAQWQHSDKDGFDPDDFIGRMLHELWNWRLLNKAREFYHEAFTFRGAAGRSFNSINDHQAFMLSMLSAFPDLALQREHFCALGDDASGYRTATRWSMRGTHTGYGMYGEPTGKAIRILGISHHIIEGGRIRAEWCLFDEFALLKQLYS